MNGEDLMPEHDNHYMRTLCNYVELRKSDYANNVPRSRLINKNHF